VVERQAGGALVGQLVDNVNVAEDVCLAKQLKERELGEAEVAPVDKIADGRRALQFDEFQRAYDALANVLAPFGEPNAGPAPAYHIVDDDLGSRELLVEVLDPGLDWEGAKRAIAMSFSESFPLWSVIVRMPGALDERIGLGG